MNKVKHISIYLIAICLISCIFITPAYAQEEKSLIETEYIYYEDYYLEVQSFKHNPSTTQFLFSSSKRVTYSKEFRAKTYSNKVIGIMKLTGNFTYNGSTCKAVSCSVIARPMNNGIYINKSSSKYSNTVTGYANFKNTDGTIFSVDGKLVCSANGNLI